MIEICTSVGAWDDATNWDALVNAAVTAAIAATPHAALAVSPAVIEISVKLGTDDEVQALNRDYRGRDATTNVLSFPMITPDQLSGLRRADEAEILLGDIIIAHGVCATEADARRITLQAHATHLIVHGVLHLLGYDHISNSDADLMETCERAVMAGLGFHDPYAVGED